MSLLNREILREQMLATSKKTHGLNSESALNWPPDSKEKPRGRAVRILNQTPIPISSSLYASHDPTATSTSALTASLNAGVEASIAASNSDAITALFPTLDRDKRLTQEAHAMWNAPNSCMSRLQQRTDDFHYSPAKKRVAGIQSDIVDSKSGTGNVIVHEPIEIRAKRRRGNQNADTTEKIFNAFEEQQAIKQQQLAVYESGNFHKDFSKQPPAHKGTAHVPPPWKIAQQQQQQQQHQQQWEGDGGDDEGESQQDGGNNNYSHNNKRRSSSTTNNSLPPVQGSAFAGGGRSGSRNSNSNSNIMSRLPEREAAKARLAEKFESYGNVGSSSSSNAPPPPAQQQQQQRWPQHALLQPPHGYSPPGLAGVGEVDAIRAKAAGKVQFRNYRQLTSLVDEQPSSNRQQSQAQQQQQQQQQQHAPVHQRISDGSRGLRTTINNGNAQRGDQVAASFESNPQPLTKATGAWLTTSSSIGNVDGSAELRDFVASNTRGGLNTRHFLSPAFAPNPIGAPISGYFRARTPSTGKM